MLNLEIKMYTWSYIRVYYLWETKFLKAEALLAL